MAKTIVFSISNQAVTRKVNFLSIILFANSIDYQIVSFRECCVAAFRLALYKTVSRWPLNGLAAAFLSPFQYPAEWVALHKRTYTTGYYNHSEYVKVLTSNFSIDQMSFLKVITGLLLTSIIVTATTCDNKCPRGDLRLDSGSRNWLPLKGKNQLTFTTQSGRTMSCRLKVVDTLQPYSAQVECSGNYFYEYINADLYLNPSGSDSIHCAMASGSQLSLRAGSDKEISMNYGNLLGQYSSTSTLTRFPTLTVGSRTYSNVILAKSMFSNGSTIDSVYIAYSYGPVGFVYHNQKYFLK